MTAKGASDLKLNDEEVRKLLEELSDEVQGDYNKRCNECPTDDEDGSNDKEKSFTSKEPAIYSLVVNCANYCRLSYAIPKLDEKYFNDITLDLFRSIPFDVCDKGAVLKTKAYEIRTDIDRFNISLDYYKKELGNKLSDDLDILKAFKIDDQGGTSYIGVDKKKKFLIVAFKGTKTTDEWVKTNFNIIGVSYKLLNPWGYTKKEVMKDVMIHGGFYNCIENLCNPEYNIFEVVEKYRNSEEFKDYRLVVTGHSLGGGLASLFGIEAQICGWDPIVITLASPKIGYVDRLGFDILSSGPSFPQKMLKLFEINVEKVMTTRNDLRKVVDLTFGGVFINIDHIGDVVPLVPLAPYERLGGIPYLLNTKNINWETNFIPQKLSLDADENLDQLIENKTFAKRTCKDQKCMDCKFDAKTLFGDTFLEQMMENFYAFNSLQEPFVQKIGEVLPFGDIYDKLAELHLFYTLYALSLDGNSKADFVA